MRTDDDLLDNDGWLNHPNLQYAVSTTAARKLALAPRTLSVCAPGAMAKVFDTVTMLFAYDEYAKSAPPTFPTCAGAYHEAIDAVPLRRQRAGHGGRDEVRRLRREPVDGHRERDRPAAVVRVQRRRDERVHRHVAPAADRVEREEVVLPACAVRYVSVVRGNRRLRRTGWARCPR